MTPAEEKLIEMYRASKDKERFAEIAFSVILELLAQTDTSAKVS